MQSFIAAATAHRPSKLGNEYSLEGPYSNYIRKKMRRYLKEALPTKIISGMALGGDTLWALVGLELQIPLLAAIPFVGQESRWSPRDQKRYKQILEDPLTETRVICSGKYSPDKMKIRNIWMVDHCDELVAVYDGDPRGGTAHTVRYAESTGRPIFRIHPLGWKKLEFEV